MKNIALIIHNGQGGYMKMVNIPSSIRASYAAAFLLLSMLPATAYNGKQVNAKAVSVQAFHTEWFSTFSTCGSSDAMMDGSIIVYTIAASKVTNKTVIYDRSLGLAQYPAFNLAGTKVAFYREGVAAAAAGGNCVSVNGGKSFISIINSDGTGLTDLCELQALPEGLILPLDWPAGNWIYFEMPHTTVFTNQGNTSLMIWRVNSVTKVAEKVCNLTDDGSDSEITCAYIHRMSLNLKGDRMALMCYPKFGCNEGTATVDFFSNVNRVYRFPPPGGNLTGADVLGRAGCNISISPSGAQVGSYFAGNHDDLFLSGTDVKISQLESWAGEKIGNGAEVIRWAVNSDKWVLQGIGLTNSGHADNNFLGCNQVVCNWTDQVAINISKNPPPFCGAVDYLTCGVPATLENSLITNNDPGDMWISDPANNPNGDRYEDLQGVWHTVDGTAVSSDRDRNGMHENSNGPIMLNWADREVSLRLPSGNLSEIRIIDIRGMTIAQQMARDLAHISLKGFAPGTYFVIVDNEGRAKNSKIIVR
jgi:hypothetical protein